MYQQTKLTINAYMLQDFQFESTSTGGNYECSHA